MVVQKCLLIKIKTTNFCLLDMLMQSYQFSQTWSLIFYWRNKQKKLEKNKTNLTHSVALYTFQEFRLLWYILREIEFTRQRPQIME